MDGRLIAGRYRLLEPHAVGGMASVWRAVDETTGDEVAIKRLHPHLVADADARERFLREAAAMSTIRHPHIVPIREAIADDEPALVMDLVAGRSLADLLEEGRAFSEAEAISIAADVADGLGAVHKSGIVHRDVKPGNVLVGDDGRARLIDFGIALALDDPSDLTAEGGVIGTLRYIAPERLAGEAADPATDVWGVGAILYELITGTPAFPATTPAERVASATARVGRPEGISDEAWRIVSRTLEPDPEGRFADASALATALRRLPGVAPRLSEVAGATALTEVIPTITEGGTVGPGRRPAEGWLMLLGDRIRAATRVFAGAVASHPMTAERRPVVAMLSVALVLVLAVAVLGGRDGRTTAALPEPGTSPAEAPVVGRETASPSVEVSAAPVDNASQQEKGKGNGRGKGKKNGR